MVRYYNDFLDLHKNAEKEPDGEYKSQLSDWGFEFPGKSRIASIFFSSGMITRRRQAFDELLFLIVIAKPCPPEALATFLNVQTRALALSSSS